MPPTPFPRVSVRPNLRHPRHLPWRDYQPQTPQCAGVDGGIVAVALPCLPALSRVCTSVGTDSALQPCTVACGRHFLTRLCPAWCGPAAWHLPCRGSRFIRHVGSEVHRGRGN